jgi:hypothetical protein
MCVLPCSVKNIIMARIFDLIIKVCNGAEPEEATPPTRRQLQQAAARGPMRWENPPAAGSSGWAILITLYRVSQIEAATQAPVADS